MLVILVCDKVTIIIVIIVFIIKARHVVRDLLTSENGVPLQAYRDQGGYRDEVPERHKELDGAVDDGAGVGPVVRGDKNPEIDEQWDDLDEDMLKADPLPKGDPKLKGLTAHG
ncbi:hypothetical protein AK812_SmicGene37956 [Symbiodinium microadriaticum]|uniref:Uncharacterized protein n=1 Tax=Symbiodinium microadriaticum TaxID=2951 RepID=A0A1Q9CEY6_SYMMI|nr:hypothetical protein AK812_SmicGene37956 [Symbiodinium microadriaticum]